MTDEQSGKVMIESEQDLLAARRDARSVANQVGFRLTDVTRIVTAASELARNILRHGGGKGAMTWEVLQVGHRKGLQLIFEDEGPGMDDVDTAMQEGFTTSPTNSLGMGLPGTKKLMDEMSIESASGDGTKITVCKWAPRA